MKTNRKTGFLISLLLSVAFVLCGMGSIFFAMHTKAYADSVDPAATTQKMPPHTRSEARILSKKFFS